MKKNYWYAIMQDNEDNDWGNGTYDLAEAEEKVENLKQRGYNDAYIAVIDEGVDDAGNPGDPVCVDEIR